MEIKDVAGSLKKGFSAYKEQYAKATRTLMDVQGNIARLQRERSDLHLHQGTREEFIAAIFAEVDRFASEGRQRRMAMLFAWQHDKRTRPLMHFDPRQFTWAALKAVASGEASFGMVALPFLMASLPNTTNDSGLLVDGPAICAVLGESIKADLKAFVAGVDWPEQQPMSERLGRIETIDAELVKLRATEAELIALIDDNSIKALEEA
ncbi:MAG: hypothetical protein A3E25_17870 [Burkholderiales bacterium RIFCSPHIGHO2_12_FULL_69_20]|nr:MAG: hypothetical protein A3E25_17870 [Burkholderiales bacterium RIFCSPHIGHO2_12_FULL_69_20]